MDGQTIAILFGVVLPAGLAMGYRFGRRGKVAPDALTTGDRNRMRHMLLELGDWTHDYSGNVTEYQDQLGKLEQVVRSQRGDAASTHRVLILLQQIMNSNEHLKDRLEAAEKQLEKQTRQIESYLSEARTDGLTGLSNRRALDQKIEDLFAAYLRGGRSFVLALIDVDKFKSVNDSHGHQVGDQVLKELSATLRSELRDALMIARFGGEEFAVILNGPLKMASDKMNSIRKTFENNRIEVGSIAMKVTISVGVSEPRNDAVVAPLIRRADEALYAAKNIGRNRVYFHDGKGPSLVGAPEVARG